MVILIGFARELIKRLKIHRHRSIYEIRSGISSNCFTMDVCYSGIAAEKVSL